MKRREMNLKIGQIKMDTRLPYRYFVNEIFPYITQIKFTTSYENWLPANRPTGAITQSDGKRKSDSAYLSVFMINTDKGKRKYTIDELKALSTFPADFCLLGDFEEQWERIGRAVPPRMMFYVAREIQEKILDRQCIAPNQVAI